MGKCIKCGKETACEWLYHTGRLVDTKQVQTDYNFTTHQSTIQVTKMYRDVQSHRVSICAKHVATTQTVKFALMFLLFVALSTGAFVIAGARFVSSGKGFVVAGIVFAVFAAIDLIVVLLNVLHLRNDTSFPSDPSNRAYDNELVRKALAIVKQQQPDADDLVYFTPKEHAELK